MKVVFFGTPQFAANILSFLLANHIEVVAVVTRPDRPKGRSGTPAITPVKEIALSHQPALPVYQPEKASSLEFVPILQAYHADLFVVAAYGEIIKQHLLDMPRLGCINVHASLLPKYRGAAPIQRCLIAGERETGVTIMKMVLKLDAGDMIETAKMPLDEKITAGELEQHLCRLGSEALLNVLKRWERGEVHAVPQDHNQATFAPKLELEDCEIDWQLSAERIHNLIRGVNPYPGAWCFVLFRGQKKRLKIFTSVVDKTPHCALPGTILKQTKNELCVACGEKQSLCILQLQLEGKKVMTTEELLRGISLDQISFGVI